MAAPLPKLRLTDLVYDATHVGRLPLRGRRQELRHIGRTLQRREQSNLVVSGQRGIGKTALLYGFVAAATAGAFPALRPLPYLRLDTTGVAALLRDQHQPAEMMAHIVAAFTSLPPSVLIIDEADTLLSLCEEPWQFEQLLQPFLRAARHLVLSVVNDSWENFAARQRNSLKHFDHLALTELSRGSCRRVLLDHAQRLATQYKIVMEEDVIDTLMEHLPHLPREWGASPRAIISLFDEACAACTLQQHTVLTSEHIDRLGSERQGLPAMGDTAPRRWAVLTTRLRQAIRGQDHVINAVAPLIVRGRLGLANPNRPIGSFLFLGPSGVGKTELAKTIAREVFGSGQAFVRIDMSEFSEPHTVQRLLGAPPGYVGHEAGGQLTNPVEARPFSLVLLDEIEKAHPSIFDIFLQVLDDGRLTDGRGQTVDFTKTIIMATSNIGVPAILAAAGRGHAVTDPDFIKVVLMPQLLEHFRPEFLNRFDALSVFAPLSPADLLAIAHLEIAKLQQRFARHNVTIELSDEVLRQKITELYDPRFGARPLKRFIEQTCETAVGQYLLQTA